MKRILIIEDDTLIADVYRDKLRAEGFAVEVAPDGKAGLDRFNRQKADLVLLDLMLPEVSGVEVLKAIRSQFRPDELPVLVLTNAYLGGVVQQAWEAGANQVFTKATLTPRLIVTMIKNALISPPPSALPQPARGVAIERKSQFDPEIRRKFLAAAPKTLAALWRPLKAVVAEPSNLRHLQELSAKVRPITITAALAELHHIAHLSAALEALLKDLTAKPDRLNPSVLLTIAQGIDTLKLLFQSPDGLAPRPPSAARILVVDDDEFTRRAVGLALERVNLSAICMEDPVRALKRRVGNHFDLIFLDIELPGESGFELCSQLRAMPAHQKTPIVFLSMHSGMEQRTESVLRGGNDFISKPFLYMELAVKALSFVLRGPLKHAWPATSAGSADSKSHDASEPFSRRELASLKQAILASFDKG